MTRRNRRWAPRLLAVLALLAACPVWAQQQEGEQKPPPDQSGLVEKVDVRLVQMAVLARDRQGRPITDLSPGEIVVKDRGRKMRLAYFEPFVDPETEKQEVPDVRLYLGAPGGWEGVQQASRAEPRYVVFWIDIENDQKLRKPEALADMVRFVREDLDDSFRIAVYSYNGDVHQEVTFTADRVAVVSALRTAFSRKARPRTDLRARIRQLLDRLEDCIVGGGEFLKQADQRCARIVGNEYADEMRPLAEDYMNALEGLVRLVGGLEGRKTIVAMSHGTPIDPATDVVEAARALWGTTEQLANLRLDITGEGARHQMDRLVELALQQEVVLHFIDRNSAPAGDFSASRGQPLSPGSRPMYSAFTSAQLDLEEMASHTGGIFIHSPNALRRGVKRAMDLERGGYSLGYYVDEYFSPKRLRKVRVSTSRKGVRLVHRRGYYARPSFADSIEGQIGIGKPVPLTEGRVGQFLPVALQVSPRQLGYELEGESASSNFTVHFAVQDGTGRILADTYHFINHAYPRQVWQSGQAEPIRITGWVELPPGKYRLTARIKNPRTGQGGSLERIVEVARVPGSPGTN